MVDSLLGDRSAKSRGRSGRLARTILLGSVAVACAIYWLARTYGIDSGELLTYLQASVVFVAFFAVVGCAGGILLWLIRRR